MDLFRNAKSVRLISYRDKYLVAEEDYEGVNQEEEGQKKSALWQVELIEGKNLIRLKSFFGTYLTASNLLLFPGASAKRVVQTWPSFSDPATEWEPVRDGMQVRVTIRANMSCFYGEFFF